MVNSHSRYHHEGGLRAPILLLVLLVMVLVFHDGKIAVSAQQEDKSAINSLSLVNINDASRGPRRTPPPQPPQDPCEPTQRLRVGVNSLQLVPSLRVPSTGAFPCYASSVGLELAAATFTAPEAGTYFIAAPFQPLPIEGYVDTVMDVRAGKDWCGNRTLSLQCVDDVDQSVTAAVEMPLERNQVVTVRVVMFNNRPPNVFFRPEWKGIVFIARKPGSCVPIGTLALNKTFMAPVVVSSLQYAPPNECEGVNPISQVMRFTAPATGRYIFSIDRTNVDEAILEVRIGSCAGPSLGCGFWNRFRFANVNITLEAGQSVVVQLSTYTAFLEQFVPVMVNSDSVTAPQEQVNAQCRPSLQTTRTQCNGRNALCAVWGFPLKWISGCGARGERGCQCASWCGYTCRRACERDPVCFWRDGTCFSVATQRPGETIDNCVSA